MSKKFQEINRAILYNKAVNMDMILKSYALVK